MNCHQKWNKNLVNTSDARNFCRTFMTWNLCIDVSVCVFVRVRGIEKESEPVNERVLTNSKFFRQQRHFLHLPQKAFYLHRISFEHSNSIIEEREREKAGEHGFGCCKANIDHIKALLTVCKIICTRPINQMTWWYLT